MRILITLRKRRTHRYLINLFTKSLIKDMRHLIANRDFTRAMDLVYKEGLMEREVLEDELPSLRADLLLSESNASWDIAK